jgi:hypothetical protein
MDHQDVTELGAMMDRRERLERPGQWDQQVARESQVCRENQEKTAIQGAREHQV